MKSEKWEADLHQENQKFLRNLINLDLINLRLLDPTPDLLRQNQWAPRDQLPALALAHGQGLVHLPGPDQGLGQDLSVDIDDHTADLDLEVEAVDIILALDQGALIPKAGVDTPGVGEMDTMTDEEDTIGLIANPQCLADVGLAEADSGIRITQNLQDVLVYLAWVYIRKKGI